MFDVHRRLESPPEVPQWLPTPSLRPTHQGWAREGEDDRGVQEVETELRCQEVEVEVLEGRVLQPKEEVVEIGVEVEPEGPRPPGRTKGAPVP